MGAVARHRGPDRRVPGVRARRLRLAGREAGLRAVARDPLFQTAVTWQNRAATRNAVAKIAAGAPAPGSRQRQRKEAVASYWQRYCAKNGFLTDLSQATFRRQVT